MRLILNIIFSGVIVILAYKSMITFRFTLWLLSVMNNSIKDYYKPLLNLVGSLCSSKFTTRAIASKKPISSQVSLILPTSIDIMGYYLGPIVEFC